MILVDSSVWIDYFRDRDTEAVATLDAVLALEPIALGDLILTEVLQGFDSERQARRAQDLLLSLELIELGGLAVAVEAASNFRALRRLGVTVRKTIDTIIATACIHHDLVLLHDDRDFDAFEQHLGLRTLR